MTLVGEDDSGEGNDGGDDDNGDVRGDDSRKGDNDGGNLDEGADCDNGHSSDYGEIMKVLVIVILTSYKLPNKTAIKKCD